jgi:hypothetical protein
LPVLLVPQRLHGLNRRRPSRRDQRRCKPDHGYEVKPLDASTYLAVAVVLEETLDQTSRRQGQCKPGNQATTDQDRSLPQSKPT